LIHAPSESFEAHGNVASIFAKPDAASITIPDAHLLFTADFKRKGSDLVLTGDDGHMILVTDYFRHEKQPDLVSPEARCFPRAWSSCLPARPRLANTLRMLRRPRRPRSSRSGASKR